LRISISSTLKALLDPANGCVKKDGSIELKAIILAKHGKWGELYR
jgi:hypothetical protein